MNRQKGITLVEALLAMAIAAAMFAGFMMLFRENQQEIRAGQVADQFRAIQQAAANHYLSNRGGMLEAMSSGQGAEHFCLIRLDQGGESGQMMHDSSLRTCAFDASLLKREKLLPADFPELNRYGERWIIIMRRIYLEDKPTGHAEMLLLATVEHQAAAGDKRYQESLMTAVRLGSSGGFVPDGDRGFCSFAARQRYEACGNGWRIDLQNFLSAASLKASEDLLNQPMR